jgi:MPBQ/MSBQ methyltransferase
MGERGRDQRRLEWPTCPRLGAVLAQIVTDDWAVQTIPAWRQSIWAGVWDPWPVISRPHLWWKVVRDAWCLEVMHRAFTDGLMEYGMFTAQKRPAAA